METIVAQVNETVKNRPDIMKLIGEDNLSMMENNHHNFTRFMESIFTNFVPETFLETVLWAMRAYRSHGFTEIYWAVELDTFIKVLKSSLSDKSFKEIEPFYKWIVTNIPIFLEINKQDA